VSAADQRRAAHFAAMAVLVADGVMDRRTAIDVLLDHESRKQPTAEQKATWPKGYATARSLARLVESGAMLYPDAELNVAAVIDGGTYTDRGMALAGKHLSRAMTGLDHMRANTAKELQQAMECPVVADAARPAEMGLQSRTEAPTPVLRAMPPRTVMRPPARPG
jgi:hypothetical protein